jgi:hypothetical protein
VVTLEGKVESEAAKARAAAVAHDTEGVTAVVDRLVVRAGSHPAPGLAEARARRRRETVWAASAII